MMIIILYIPLNMPHNALKWMDEVNDHYLGYPLHFTNFMRVDMIQFILSIHTPINKRGR